MKKIFTFLLVTVLSISAWAASATFDFANGAALFGFTGASDKSSKAGDFTTDKTAVVDGIKFTVSGGSYGASNTPNRIYMPYGQTKSQLRVYGGSIIVEAPQGQNITGIQFVYDETWNEPEADNGSFIDGTWVGNTAKLTLTITKQCRIAKAIVSYSGEDTTPQPTDTLPEINSFKDFRNAVVNDTKFRFTGNAIVTYQYQRYTWVRSVDEKGYGYSGLIYGQDSIAYKPGDVIPAGWVGVKTIYKGTAQIINVEGLKPAATQVDSSFWKAFDFSTYIGSIIEEPEGLENDYDAFAPVTLSNIDNKGHFTITEFGTNKDGIEGHYTIPGYNKFKIAFPEVSEDKKFAIEGIISIYNGKAQLMPTKITEVEASTPLWKMMWYIGKDREKYQIADTLFVVKATKGIEKEENSKNYIYVTDNVTSVYNDIYADQGVEYTMDWRPDVIALDCGDNETLYNTIAGMKAIAPKTLFGTRLNGKTNQRLIVEKTPTALDVETPEFHFNNYDLTTDTIFFDAHEVANTTGYYKTIDGKEYFCGSADDTPLQPIDLDRRYLGNATLTNNTKYVLRGVYKIKDEWEGIYPAPGMNSCRAMAKTPTRTMPDKSVSYTDPLYYKNYTFCPFEIIEIVSTGVAESHVAKTIATVKYVSVTGIESTHPFNGVNMVITTYTDGSKTTSKIVK